MPTVSGGASGLSTATVTLTNAQVKALPTASHGLNAGFEFLASPGAGTVLLVISGLLVKYGAAYTNVNAATTLVIAHSGFNDFDNTPEIQCGGGGLLDTASDVAAMIPLTSWEIQTTAQAANVSPLGLPPVLSALDGAGLVLVTNNQGDGDFTGGAAGNRLVVHLLYTVLNV